MTKGICLQKTSGTLICFIILFLSPILRAENRIALVIGIDKYENLPANAQLKVAVSDAVLLSDSLKKASPPFEVDLKTDASQEEIEDALDNFIDRAKDAECALIYFAGHGVEYHGENFLLVRDTKIPEVSEDVRRMKRKLGNDAISLQMVLDDLDASKADVKVIILDCCRDNPLEAESPGGTRSVVGKGGGLAQVTPPSGTLISYSADAGQKANDGLFTATLAKHLQKPNTPILRVFAATRQEVRETSRQWADEDRKKGLPPENRRVMHEPAEYNKLDLTGMDFAFVARKKNTKPSVAATPVTPPSPKPTAPKAPERMTPTIPPAPATPKQMNPNTPGNQEIQAEIDQLRVALKQLQSINPQTREIIEETEEVNRRILGMQEAMATATPSRGVAANNNDQTPPKGLNADQVLEWKAIWRNIQSLEAMNPRTSQAEKELESLKQFVLEIRSRFAQ